MLNLIKTWSVGGMDVLFFEKNNTICMGMLPAGMKPVLDHRDNVDDSVAARDICKLPDVTFPAFTPESMLQLKISGDIWGYGPAGAGMDMRNTSSCDRFRLQTQTATANSCVSEFASKDGLKAVQKLSYQDGTEYIECRSSLYNGSSETIRVEMFSSFSLGMISLLHNDDSPDCLKVHRFATFWSAESRHLENSFEELGLDMSWQAAGPRCLRFGHRSSKVTNEYAPFAAVEDTANGVVWAAAVEALTPWQMEVSRSDDFANISGGLPDREFAGWFVDLKPGETLEAPAAILTVCKGTFNRAARQLLAYQRTNPPVKNLVPLFSDWCTSWGIIDEQRLLKVAELASANFGVRCFAVDDGWFQRDTPGDWELNTKVFPLSFRHFSDEINQRFGLKSGIWFELETLINPDINNLPHKELLLTLDGKIIYSGCRCFWDFRKPETIAHLTHKVADFLRENHVGYLKIDYNAQIPFGIDGPTASPAANLQDMLNCVVAFHRKLRELVPGLLIEECASGGTRMSPGWLRQGDYLSCTDAHEGIEIPALAADSMLLCLYDKALVWATLRPSDDEARLSYSLCAAMLGQMVLSGDLDLLSPKQLEFARKFTAFYAGISPELRQGELTIQRQGKNRTRPKGTQIVTLEAAKEMLVVVHFFETAETSISCVLPGQGWKLVEWVSISTAKAELAEDGTQLQLSGMLPFSAASLRLTR